jgi:hypothetical protein
MACYRDSFTFFINFLDIIQRPVFLKTFRILDTVSVLRQKPTQLGPIDRASPYLLLMNHCHKILGLIFSFDFHRRQGQALLIGPK